MRQHKPILCENKWTVSSGPRVSFCAVSNLLLWTKQIKLWALVPLPFPFLSAPTPHSFIPREPLTGGCRGIGMCGARWWGGHRGKVHFRPGQNNEIGENLPALACVKGKCSLGFQVGEAAKTFFFFSIDLGKPAWCTFTWRWAGRVFWFDCL